MFHSLTLNDGSYGDQILRPVKEMGDVTLSQKKVQLFTVGVLVLK